jgi:GNAT superfamily N-acetyltransferase
VSRHAQEITLAPTSESDFDALVDLRIEAMRESLERAGRFDAVRARERFRSGFSPLYTKYIVCGATRVGFVAAKPQPEHLLLDHLYIRPEHQGQGIGGVVLQLVFAQADALDLPVKVGALRDSDSNRFYARHGFQLAERGEFDNYYLRPPQRVRANNSLQADRER